MSKFRIPNIARTLAIADLDAGLESLRRGHDRGRDFERHHSGAQRLLDGRQPVSQARAKLVDAWAPGGDRPFELQLLGPLHVGADGRRWASPEGREQDERAHAPMV